MNQILVTNNSTLKAMARAGLIVLTEDTFKFKYVYDGPRNFTYKGQEYSTQYSSGCFYPFVYKLK